MKMEKKFKNRILSLMLTFVMVLCLLPTKVSASDLSNVYVGGVNMGLGETAYYKNGDTSTPTGTQDDWNAKLWVNGGVLTLTLNGLNVTAENSYGNAGIYCLRNEPLHIVLADGSVNYVQGPQFGIRVSDDLIISGNGSLNASSNGAGDFNYGIRAVQLFEITSGTVNATGGTSTNANSYGIGTYKFNMSGGTVNAIGGNAATSSYGIDASNYGNNDGFTMTGGTVNAVGGTGKYSVGIYGMAAVNGGKMSASGDNSALGKGADISDSVTPILVGTNAFDATIWDDTTGITNYKYMSAGIPDTNGSILTAGAINRISNTKATVNFTCNEAGTYYYLVAEPGNMAPTGAEMVIMSANAQNLTGSCIIGDNAISLTQLSEGAKVIYIAVKDMANNVSNMLTMNIPVYEPPATYTVTFNANGGTGNMPSVSAYGEYTLPSNNFTAQSGYQFKGWAESANGEVITTETITVTDDTTLYAIWQKIPAEKPSVQISENLTLTYGEFTNQKITANVVKKDGYTYSYQWVNIDNNVVETTDTLNIPDNLDAGIYDYACIVFATRDDNGEYNSDIIRDIWVKVDKATPTYNIPVGLTAIKGQTLGEITLDEGFSWQDSGTTPVGDVGDNTFKVTYTPVNTANYKIVKDIDVTISVSRKVVTVQAECDDGWGTVSGAGEYDQDAKVTLTATANEDTKFRYWLDTSVQLSNNPTEAELKAAIVSYDAEYTFTATDNVNLKAVFSSNQPIDMVPMLIAGTDEKSLFDAEWWDVQHDFGSVTPDSQAITLPNELVKDKLTVGDKQYRFKGFLVFGYDETTDTETVELKQTITIDAMPLYNSAEYWDWITPISDGLYPAYMEYVPNSSDNSDKKPNKTPPKSNELNESKKAKDSKKPLSPKTGDNSHIVLWIALAFISGGAVITLTANNRKKQTEKLK